MGICWTPPATRWQRALAALLVASVYTFEVADGLSIIDNLLP